MREIEFRAWDEHAKVMVHDGDYWYPKMGKDEFRHSNDVLKLSGMCYEVGVTNKGIFYTKKVNSDYVEVYIDGKQRTFYSTWECEELWSRDIVLEQYIGISDKDGVKIFEGDIVEVEFYKDCRCGKLKEKAVIIFYANSWCTDITPFYPDCVDGWCRELKSDDRLAVISNIHKNPELLKEKCDE